MTHTVARLGIAILIAAVSAAAAQQQQPPPQGQKPPVFRGGVNIVQVDAYPRRDGKIVEGLTAADFDVFEDGKLQAIESVEFVRIEPNAPVNERRDPNTQEEGFKIAADPRSRVFVLYLDHFHLNLDASHRMRLPVVAMLNRMLTTTDLFGVMTPLLRPRDLILGRQTSTIEEQLTKHWTWGQTGTLYLEPDEEALWRCQQIGVPGDLIGRRRQEKLFENLDGLMRHLGVMREARKVLILFTRGWQMYQREENSPGYKSAIPQVGVDPNGKLTTNNPADFRADRSACNTIALRLNAIETFDEIKELLVTANQNNVSIYPVNPAGLETPTLNGGNQVDQFNSIRDRWQTLLTVAENTDGLAVNSNDLGAVLRRVADDVSAYYLLSYASTNQARDGKFRRIEVKSRARGIDVKARRGYVAPDDTPRPAAAGTPTTTVTADDDVKGALSALARLRPTAEVFTSASRTASDVTVVAEIPMDLLFSGDWKNGGSVEVSVSDASGAQLGTGSAPIAPLTRGASITIPVAAAAGPLAISTRVTGGAKSLADRIDVPAPASGSIGTPLVFRARPPASAPLLPAADPQFRRTERLHVEWPVAAPMEARQARLLGRNGQPLSIPLTVTERHNRLAVDLNLAPLTDGDYVIELVAGTGGTTERSLTAFRVIR